MYPGETSFQRQTFARNQSHQYPSQGRSEDQSQGTEDEEMEYSSDHSNNEESEADENNEGHRRTRRWGPK